MATLNYQRVSLQFHYRARLEQSKAPDFSVGDWHQNNWLSDISEIQVRFGARNRCFVKIDPVCCGAKLIWTGSTGRFAEIGFYFFYYYIDVIVVSMKTRWGPSIVILGTIAMIHINCSMPKKFPHDLPRAEKFPRSFHGGFHLQSSKVSIIFHSQNSP